MQVIYESCPMAVLPKESTMFNSRITYQIQYTTVQCRTSILLDREYGSVYYYDSLIWMGSTELASYQAEVRSNL